MEDFLGLRFQVENFIGDSEVELSIFVRTEAINLATQLYVNAEMILTFRDALQEISTAGPNSSAVIGRFGADAAGGAVSVQIFQEPMGSLTMKVVSETRRLGWSSIKAVESATQYFPIDPVCIDNFADELLQMAASIGKQACLLQR